jgi:hypothetical protein
MKEIQQQIKNCEIKANRQVSTCHIPKYLSCSENKGKKRSHKQHRGTITQDDNHPESNTAIDHIGESYVARYTWKHKGRPTLKKYKNFTLSVHHKTRLLYPSFQESKTAPEACRSKYNYEKFAQQYQVTVKSYHADNGAFRSKTFQKEIDNKNQQRNFSRVNTQWKNGLVERSQGTLCATELSMLNNAISRREKTIKAELWPFTIQHAATIYNTTKRRSRDYDISRVNARNLTKLICTHYSVRFMFLKDVCKRAHKPLNTQNAQHKRFTLDTFTTNQKQCQWFGTRKQNWFRHNFMSCLTTTSTPSKHPIQTSNKRIRRTTYLKQTDTHMMIHLGTNTHSYSLAWGEQIYTQTT